MSMETKHKTLFAKQDRCKKSDAEVFDKAFWFAGGFGLIVSILVLEFGIEFSLHSLIAITILAGFMAYNTFK